ncbi:hypothetical protein [Bradyrhizobium denitrificans]|uniref:hypothetical protein n=1 Tax=Bradyrhizobium denitrificans TaxID=2734912 RepID=UPI001557490B|nr:hypothetical protein [Bradyrhizobium sp. LMG 8443]NPU23973.1 hypothetical protein [Bradyrhizobium sp. LMG 8443]
MGERAFKIIEIAFLGANFALGALNLLVLYAWQVPVFSADEKLKGIDFNLKTIESSVSEQKAKIDLLQNALLSTERTLKLIQDLSPRLNLDFAKAEYFGRGSVEITLSLKNEGQYTIAQIGPPFLRVSKTPLDDCDSKESEVDISEVKYPAPVGALNPSSKALYTVRLRLPADLRVFWYCVKFHTEIDSKLIDIAKKALDSKFDNEIESHKVAYTWLSSKITLKGPGPISAGDPNR